MWKRGDDLGEERERERERERDHINYIPKKRCVV